MANNKPHKHAELIKAWADGAEIEFHSHDDVWFLVAKPNWDIEQEYRIKPEPKPDSWTLYFAERGRNPVRKLNRVGANLRLIWDGETGELKGAEVLK